MGGNFIPPAVNTHKEYCQSRKDSIVNTEVLNLRVGEIALQLNTRSALVKDLNQFPALKTGAPKWSLTPAPEDPMPFSDFHRHCTHGHIPTHSHIHRAKINLFVRFKVQHNTLDYYVNH